MARRSRSFRALAGVACLAAASLTGVTGALLGVCGPFSDVTDARF